MKYTLALCASLLVASCFAQDLMSVPGDSVTVRLNLASTELKKAAWNRNTSIWFAAIGGIFTGLAMDKSAKAYQPDLAFGLGAVTAACFFTFQLNGARHDKRAAIALHQ
jgi:hypothetical protein